MAGDIPVLVFPDEDVQFWATADWHIGQQYHAGELFQQHLARACEERWNLFHLGDALELVIPSHRLAQRGALREQIKDPEAQRLEFIEILKRLPGRGVLLPGNHEFRIDAVTGLDFIKSVTDAVGERYICLRTPGFVRLQVGRQTYHVYMHHGEGPVVSPTTLFDRLQRDTEDVDLILTGHIHASTFDPAEKKGPAGQRLVLRLRCGHYLEAPAYAQRYPIARMGARGSWLLTFHPREHRIDTQWLR